MVRKFPPFRSERKKRTTSGGSLQFPYGFSGKLQFHLTLNRNFRIFVVPVRFCLGVPSKLVIRGLKQTTRTTETRGLMNKTFLCRPLQNNNVKWPRSAPSTERGRQLIFRISIWNWRPSLHIWLKHVFGAIGVPNRSRQPQISLVE